MLVVINTRLLSQSNDLCHLNKQNIKVIFSFSENNREKFQRVGSRYVSLRLGNTRTLVSDFTRLCSSFRETIEQTMESFLSVFLNRSRSTIIHLYFMIIRRRPRNSGKVPNLWETLQCSWNSLEYRVPTLGSVRNLIYSREGRLGRKQSWTTFLSKNRIWKVGKQFIRDCIDLGSLLVLNSDSN